MNDVLLLSINSLSGKSIVLDNIVLYGVPILFLILAGIILFTKSKKLFITTIITLLISGLIDLIFNLTLNINRPFASEIANQITSISSHSPTNSFPSTHTLIAFSLAFPVFLFYYREKLLSRNKLWIGLIALSLAFIIGLSRLYLGVHWSTDVLGSVIITLIVSYFVSKFVDENKYFGFLR